MDFRILGWSDDGPALELDHREFAYAGKFVMTNTGKAIACDEPLPDEANQPETGASSHGEATADIVAAVSFSPDRTDSETLWIRYLTVRKDRQGETIGGRLSEYVSTKALERGFDRVRIAVNNPLSYEAMYKAGFGFTGEETGLAELVLERPMESDPGAYQSGLDLFRTRDLSDSETRFLSRKQGASPPDLIASRRS